MSSGLLAYIATDTTSDPYVAPTAINLAFLARDTSDAFVAISGGHRIVGELKFFPVQRSVPGYLLCDGKEVAKASFPELYRYLGDTEGTPANPANFVLPNYIAAASFTPATTSQPETVVNGTATVDPLPTPPTPTYNDEFMSQWESAGRPPEPF